MPLPIIDKDFKITNEKCSYCKTSPAIIKYNNGNFCCQEVFTQCPELRKKNSQSLKESYQKEDRSSESLKNFYSKLPEETKERMAWSRGLTSITDDRIKSTRITRKAFQNSKTTKYECSECQLSEWKNKPISLEMDHIDGNRNNHDLNNLRWLCPNCHSQTETFRGKNINTGNKIVSDEDFIISLKNHKSIRQALISLGLAPKGGNYSRAYHLLSLINLSEN